MKTHHITFGLLTASQILMTLMMLSVEAENRLLKAKHQAVPAAFVVKQLIPAPVVERLEFRKPSHSKTLAKPIAFDVRDPMLATYLPKLPVKKLMVMK
jgi:hypothetical protein